MNKYRGQGRAIAAHSGFSRRAFLAQSAAFGATAPTVGALLANAAWADTPQQGGTLKVGVTGETSDSMDPARALSIASILCVKSAMEYLVNVTADGQLDYRMAESAEPSDGGKTWTFKIRQGVEFHNGKTLTPEDVLKTMQRHSDETSESGALGLMRGVESMKVDGDYFQMTLLSANADLPYLLSDFRLPIQPDGGFDDPKSGIGTGAYVLDEFEPGVRATFKKFGNYWKEDEGHFDGLECLVINDSTARAAAIQSNQVQAMFPVDPKTAQLLGRAPNIDVVSAPGGNLVAFVMQTDVAPFDNPDLRMALKLAVNRQELVDKVFAGLATPGNDFPVNSSYPLFDDSIPQREYDVAKAAELYKKSGHDGSPIVLHVSDVAFQGAVDAASLFQQSAQAAGIPIEIKREPSDGYWAEVWQQRPFFATQWGGRPVQDQIYSAGYLSSADFNETHIRRDDVDEMILGARGELDPEKRKEIYSKLAYVVRDEGGLILPVFGNTVSAISKQLGGYHEHPALFLMNARIAYECWFKS
ncbi:ABC transporter substrate-binding protein [Ruegeria halocynthiae]|uniref:ABC transporter substrate-binding protein n=1 Tax=Ruegeria halocynthiae TaxID=985054 RepID=UPI00069171A7|nr:ABC transporter substrate-binding protein [Ruegeria halocynthiae]